MSLTQMTDNGFITRDAIKRMNLFRAKKYSGYDKYMNNDRH